MAVIANVKLPAKMPWRKVLPKPVPCNRDSLLLELACGKSVLHVGAVDAPLTQEKFYRKELLHLKLRSIASRLVGVDISQDGVNFLNEQTGIHDIVLADVIKDKGIIEDERLKQKFDLVYCCDIIEHVSNPGNMLKNLIPFCHADSQIVITTPNALSIKAALRPLVMGKEFIHPDHVTFFSFSSLSELMRRYDIEPVGYAVFGYETPNPLAKFIFKTLYRLSPNSAEGLIMIGKPLIVE